MNPNRNDAARRGLHALVVALLAALLALGMSTARSQSLIQGNYYWYVPEHERYGRSQFYSEPRFDTAQVRVTRTQRFRLVTGGRGWFTLEFDIAGKAHIHMRLLRSLVYDPAAVDPWHEFKRASVFTEEPAKIEARLKAGSVAATQQPAPSNVPAWKRYREGWNLKGSRAATPAPETGEPGDGAVPAPRAAEKKPRNKYPLLPPIGAEPVAPDDGRESSSDSAAGNEPAR
jgi:hypothetical protein